MNGQWIGGYSGTNSGQLVIARKDLGHVLVQMRAHDDPQAVDLLGVRRHRISRQNPTSYVVKFKAEALPLKDEVGGYRLLFSHNVEFGLSQAPEGDRTSMHTLTRIFPCLTSELQTDADRVELVNQTIVEEVLQDLGTLDFGRGMAAKFNVAIWRERGMHRPLAGEFAFQVKFKQRDDLHEKVLDRAKRFFVTLQQNGRDWPLARDDEDGDRLSAQREPAASA